MTVANTLVTREAAYLVTDGGWTDLATRKLMDIKDKVFEVEGTHTVLTALGGKLSMLLGRVTGSGFEKTSIPDFLALSSQINATMAMRHKIERRLGL